MNAQMGTGNGTRRLSGRISNAVAESFFATVNVELLHRQDWATRAAARLAIFEYVEGWYIGRRRHYTLGYATPAAYEALAKGRRSPNLYLSEKLKHDHCARGAGHVPRGQPGDADGRRVGGLVQDDDVADVFPIHGQPAEGPTRLALATILQFMEGLTDRQAAEAVQTRIDWNYRLCLELTDQGVHHTVLSAFCSRLLSIRLNFACSRPSSRWPAPAAG